MKKVAFFLLFVLMSFSAFAQTLTTVPAFYIYLKGTGMILPEEEYLNYAKYFEKNIYKQYFNDEFEWDDQYANLKNELNNKIESAQMSGEYVINTEFQFGKYDTEKSGFTVSIPSSTFFPLGTMVPKPPIVPFHDDTISKDSILCRTLAVKIDSLSDYNLIPMEKDAAKEFLQARKDSSGNVNRSLIMSIKYKLADFSSEEYLQVKRVTENTDYLPLVGIIESIEIYKKSGKQFEKFGTIVKAN